MYQIDRIDDLFGTKAPECWKTYSNPKSFVNLLLPPQGIGEGWGGVKNLRLLQELLYIPLFIELYVRRSSITALGVVW